MSSGGGGGGGGCAECRTLQQELQQQLLDCTRAGVFFEGWQSWRVTGQGVMDAPRAFTYCTVFFAVAAKVRLGWYGGGLLLQLQQEGIDAAKTVGAGPIDVD